MAFDKDKQTAIIVNQLRQGIYKLIILAVVLCLFSCGDDVVVTIDKTDNAVPEPVVKINSIKLYIENSASMDGYVKGGADFKNAVHSYISEIKNLTDSVNLNFVNEKIIPMGGDITGFFKNLNTPDDFRKAGGKRSSTDIAVIINKVLDSAQANDVSVIVSDFIFSPGKKDASRYLGEQQIIIKDIFSERLKNNPNFAVMFFRLTANFSGSYFNREDKTTKLQDQERPFYMLVIGQKNALKQIRDKVPESKIARRKDTDIQMFIIENKIDMVVAEKIRPGSKKILKGKDSKGLKFALNVSIPNTCLIDKAFLENPDNYKIEDENFNLVIKSQNNDTYTHIFEFTSSVPQNTVLNVRLMKSKPDWIEQYNDDEGLNIDSALDKTYGLDAIVSGIFEAFTRGNDYYTQLPKITINVKQ
ncbi:MAG: hypothetical protein IKP73_03360 [Bacteroidales bacterium]|nr:hypothetical protein [Bacteroidales bacterium]